MLMQLDMLGQDNSRVTGTFHS